MQNSTDIPDLKQRIRLSEVIAGAVALRQLGAEKVGLCPFHQEATGSFSVNDEKGVYFCRGCGATGDIFKWIEETERCDFKTALARVRGLVGQIEQDGLRYSHRQQFEPVHPTRVNDELQKSIKGLFSASAGYKPSGAVEKYLSGRGLNLAKMPGVDLGVFHFNPSLYHKETRDRLPGMLVRIDDAQGQIIGIHRTFLKVHPDGRVTKAPVSPAKKMLGHHSHGAARLCAPAKIMQVAEGIETALSVMQATGIATWAALSLSNMENICLPDECEKVILCTDNDMKDDRAAEVAIQRAATAHVVNGRKVEIARPPKGFDFNDMLKNGVKV